MKKTLQVHNKSSKPDNLVARENELIEQCRGIELELPYFFRDYFLFLKSSVSLNTRLAYLLDLRFFLRYLIQETTITQAEKIESITETEFFKITARDVNYYLGDYCSRYIVEKENARYIMENHNRALSRKRSSISVLFKFLYRQGFLPVNITDGFNPIKLPKPQPDAIKRLHIDEVGQMFDAVAHGAGLTPDEQKYWEKTKRRDKAILMLFTTYGLRLSELQGLNVSSFNFKRGEFMIFRKRGKEVLMPINRSAQASVTDYIEHERSLYLPKAPKEDEDALFLSLQGRRMNMKSIRELVKKYTSIPLGTTRSGGYSPHKLRATAASSLIEYGFSIYDVQNLLDHDNVTTTQLYAAHKKHVKRDIVTHYELDDSLDEEALIEKTAKE